MRTRSLLLVPAVALAAACGAPADDAVPEPPLAIASTTAVATPEVATRTPIKHVIVIIGENRTFDHVFATYRPRHTRRSATCSRSDIINEDGTPGPNYALATQFSAVDAQPEGWELSAMQKSLYDTLPPPLAGGPTQALLLVAGRGRGRRERAAGRATFGS